MVVPGDELVPDRARAVDVTDRLKDRGILASNAGAFANVLKLRPPLVLQQSHADEFWRLRRRAGGTRWLTGAVAPYELPARKALREFGIGSARLSLVGISENVTFRADDDNSGRAYVLRLHRPGYHTLEELNSERVWLEALGGSGISVPTPVAAPDGRYFVPVEIADDETRQVGLNLWAPGEIVGELLTAHDKSTEAAEPAEITEPFGQLGGLMAAMHNQAANWIPPSSFRRHRLDLDGLLGEAPFWGPFWENPVLDGRERGPAHHGPRSLPGTAPSLWRAAPDLQHDSCRSAPGKPAHPRRAAQP